MTGYCKADLTSDLISFMSMIVDKPLQHIGQGSISPVGSCCNTGGKSFRMSFERFITDSALFLCVFQHRADDVFQASNFRSALEHFKELDNGNARAKHGFELFGENDEFGAHRGYPGLEVLQIEPDVRLVLVIAVGMSPRALRVLLAPSAESDRISPDVVSPFPYRPGKYISALCHHRQVSLLKRGNPLRTLSAASSLRVLSFPFSLRILVISCAASSLQNHILDFFIDHQDLVDAGYLCIPCRCS